MKLLGALLLLGLVSGAELDPHRAGFDTDGFPMSKIVGGVEVNPPGKYPFMVFGRGCGGSLITPNKVLTAGHCVSLTNPGSNGPVYLGRHTRTGGDGANVIGVVRHPTYGTSQESDTAILTLDRSFFNYSTIALDAGNGGFSAIGQPNTVIGWGAIRENGPSATTLQEVSLPVISNAVCSAAVGGVNSNEICMGNPEGGQDACQGDSGGPMFHQNNGNWVQTGVVSWGIGCARPNRYGVYARVSGALPWILQNAPDARVAK